ncbi:MAG: MmgE/PrpD family protein [Pseudorhodoplanes sp.]|uniref:MmgE/PrpD family protein n=1 Tax=Pseudorhodoplanes sp. TaxID=1934341 RepID=UPI003D143F4E
MLQVVKQAQGGVPDAVTRAVVDELAARRIEQYPADIVELAKQCVIDFIAVTLAGTRESGAQAVAEELLDGRDGVGPVTLIGLAQRASALDAALINGMAAHALDYDDVSLPMSAHASVVILPALLALAEKRKSSGLQVLESFVAGYEAGARIGMYMAPTHYDSGFHGTGTIGTFAAAAACSHLMRLDADRTERAIGIAAAQAAGIRSMFGTDCKPLHAGKGAFNGLFAALLAARGFTSATGSVECANGFAATHAGARDGAEAFASPPGGFFLRQNLFKYHAACYMTHAAANAIAQTMNSHALSPDAVERIVVTADQSLNSVCNIADPDTGLGMKFSLRTVAALAMLGRDTSALSSFTDGAAGEPDIARAREKIEVELADIRPITRTGIRLIATDGRAIEAEHDSGKPETDLGVQRARLQGKFRALAGEVLGADRADQLLAQIDTLDRQPDMSVAMRFASAS